MIFSPKQFLIFFILGNASFHILKTPFMGAAINSQLLVQGLFILNMGLMLSQNKFIIAKIHAPVLLTFLAYISLAWLSLLYTNAELNVEFIGLLITFLFIVSLSFILWKVDEQQDLQKIGDIIIYVGVLQAVLGVMQVIFNHPIVPKDHSWEWLGRSVNRASGTYRDPVDFGFYMVFCIFIIKYRIFTSSFIQKLKKLIYCLVFCAIIASQSLTNILGLVVGYVVFVILGPVKQKIWYTLALVGLASIVIGIFSQGTSMFQGNTIASNIEQRIVGYSNSDNEPRQLHMKIGYTIMQENHYLGSGYGTFSTLSPQYVDTSTYMGRKLLNGFLKMNTPQMISHSLVATIMAELGVLGLIIIGVFFFNILKPGLTAIAFPTRKNLFYLSIIGSVICKTLFYGFRLSDAFLFFVIMYSLSIRNTHSSPEDVVGG